MKAPYQVLFSNDTTNIETCVSPYRAKGEPFRPEMLEATVDETAGVGIDVHLLQPGLGWVPWWKSKVYPFEEHIAFMKEATGMDPAVSGFANYMAQGGDMVEVFCRRCRQKGLSPFVSFRLNDVHGHEFTQMPKEQIPSFAWHCFSPVHVQHPEWRLGSINDWNGKALNWAIPEVPRTKFTFIREIVEQYDIDGFELDFMRHCNFFKPEETPLVERRAIMTRFVRSVREALDARDAADGRHRWLCVRIPARTSLFDFLGLDVVALTAAGVEMFNLSNYYYTEHRGDFAQVRELVGSEVSLYFEMCHTIQQRTLPTEFKYDNTLQRRTTPTQYATGAHLAYSRGCDGTSTFNFVYYREHGVGERGPATEPPFDIHRTIGNPTACAAGPQHYIMSEGWGGMGLESTPLPTTLQAGELLEAQLDFAPPLDGWRKGGRLRIQSDNDLADSTWSATFNGVALEETADRTEPYDNPYPQLLGKSEEYRAWTVPPELLKNGVNKVEVALIGGLGQARIVFLDVAVE